MHTRLLFCSLISWVQGLVGGRDGKERRGKETNVQTLFVTVTVYICLYTNEKYLKKEKMSFSVSQ